MKKRLGGVLAGQILGLLIVCVASAFIALVSFGAIGGVTIASAPEETFQYIAPLTCPDGKMEYQQYRASYNRPGETSIIVECVTADGTRTDITGSSILYALVGFYLACFLPLCIPGGLLAIVIPMFFLRGKKQEAQSEAIGSL
ncbi:MAG: hypothetical protein HYZ21_15940 [Chloroflexi bacterium]|nr:hypothetical protein [Chloroflexota bacterium]